MNQRKNIRVVLIDDHTKIHRAIAALIDFLEDVELIAQGSNGTEAVQLCEQYQPDIVLMDVIMPNMNGIEATRAILEKMPEMKILALSSFQDAESIRAMIDAGAVGYLLKNTSIDDLANTLRAVHAGKMVFSAEATEVLFHSAEEPTQDYGLTPRELETLRFMVEGLNNREIADALTISEATVKFHVSNILTKLDVDSRVEAVILALENHIIS